MKKLVDMGRSACDYLSSVEQKYSSPEGERRPHIKRLSFDLANIYGALPIGKLTLVCGADETVSMFLSWLAVRLASGKLPVICALNCSASELAGRLISVESNVPLAFLNAGAVKREDWVPMTRAAGAVADSNIAVAEESDTPLHLLAAQAAALGQKDRPGVLIVAGGAGGAPEELNSLAHKYGIAAIMAADCPSDAILPAGLSTALVLNVHSYALGKNTMGIKVSALINGTFVDWGKTSKGKDCICVGTAPSEQTNKQPGLFRL